VKWSKPNPRRMDPEMIEAIKILNGEGVKTLGCCCGHGKYKPTIVIRSVMGIIVELLSGEIILRKKKFYKYDKKTGCYYIPEVHNKK